MRTVRVQNRIQSSTVRLGWIVFCRVNTGTHHKVDLHIYHNNMDTSLHQKIETNNKHYLFGGTCVAVISIQKLKRVQYRDVFWSLSGGSEEYII